VIRGAPDLIVQMLDKAHRQRRGLQPRRSVITVRLRLDAQAALIEVDNPGPALPVQVEGRLFESLWQSRAGTDSRPALWSRPVHRATDRRVSRRRGLCRQPPRGQRRALRRAPVPLSAVFPVGHSLHGPWGVVRSDCQQIADIEIFLALV